MTTIPQLVHFIYLTGPNSRPWSFLNDKCLAIARNVYPTEKFVLWTNDAQLDVSHVRDVEVSLIDPPTSLNGIAISQPQVMADVLRLQILLEHGGIYMDTDIIALKPIYNLNPNNLLMSWETPSQQSVCNALIASPPNNPFVQEWYDIIPSYLNTGEWAASGVLAPLSLVDSIRLHPHRTILPSHFCCALDLSQPWLFNPDLKSQAAFKTRGVHAVHVFETYWRDTVVNIDENWINNTDCYLSSLLKSS